MSSDNSFRAAQAKSTSTFLSALVISASVAGIQIAVFLLLRTSIRKIYAPRAYLPVPSKRSQQVSSTPWGWVFPTLKTPSESMIPTAGLDAFMYLRFLKLMIFIFGPTSCLVSIVLLPLNAIGTSVSSRGLNSFAFGNIPEDRQIRYVGHLLCAYVVTIWVVFLIRREMSSYIQLRQQYLTSQRHLDLPQSRTVLVTGVPTRYLSTDALKQMTAHLPGGIKQVWISRELKNMPDLYDKRQKVTAMLEAAEVKLCKAAVKQSNKTSLAPLSPTHTKEVSEESSDPVDQFVRRKSRPRHRLGFMGFVGHKVDTVDWCKAEIVRLTKELEEQRKKLDQLPPHNSAFIEFHERLAAQIFSQIVLYHQPLRMAKRYVDAAPEDIIWDNLNINPYDERIRNMVSWVFTIGLVVLWSFPVAFIGSLSNITSLCTTVKWLSWLCRSQSHIQDIVQGILPPVLLALIFLILPMILRLIGRYSGLPRISEIELILMTRYYIFLVIHGFIVTTLSSGLTAAIPALSKDPSQAVTILTVNLPRASIFFMTYMITTCLTSAAASLLQVFTLILYYLKLSVFASTPRSVFDIRYTMARPQFGTLFPNTTLLATIGLAYSIIAPIMSILALLGFSIYWVVYKYLFLFVFDIPAAHETGGRFFPLAMNHVFVGLYISQVCLTGLFFLARNEKKEASSIGEGAMMIVLLFLTFFSHVMIRNSYKPLTMFVPLNMMEEGYVDGNATTEPQEVLLGNDDHQKQQALLGNGEHQNQQAFLENDEHRTPRGPNRQLEWADQTAAEDDGETIQRVVEASPSESEFRQKELPPIAEHPRFDSPVPMHSPACLRDQPMSARTEKSRKNSQMEEIYYEQGRTAFLHPAVWEKTRPIWIPEDPIGVARLEVKDMKRRKIPASMNGAQLTGSGKVWVTRSPPENAEVIELERQKVEGIFALPGAIGGAARAAGGKIGEKVLAGAAKSQGMHSRKHSSSTVRSNGSGGVSALKKSLSGVRRKRERGRADGGREGQPEEAGRGKRKGRNKVESSARRSEEVELRRGASEDQVRTMVSVETSGEGSGPESRPSGEILGHASPAR